MEAQASTRCVARTPDASTARRDGLQPVAAGRPVRHLSAASELGRLGNNRLGRAACSRTAASGRRWEACAGTRWANLGCNEAARMPPASDLKGASAGGDWRRGRPGGRSAGPGQQRLRAAGLGREKDTAGPRGKALARKKPSVKRSGCLACPESSQTRSPVRAPAGHKRESPALADSKAPGRMALPG